MGQVYQPRRTAAEGSVLLFVPILPRFLHNLILPSLTT